MTAAALLLLIPLFAPPEVPADPIIEGRPLSAWVADLADPDDKKQQLAATALTKAGPKAKPAVPHLVKMLDPKDNRVGWALEILRAIGPDAKEAVPALLTLLPKDGGFVPFVDRISLTLAKIDGVKPEATRALLLSYAKCTRIVIVNSGTMNEYPAQVVPHLVAL